jgi:hypothetical protein
VSQGHLQVFVGWCYGFGVGGGLMLMIHGHTVGIYSLISGLLYTCFAAWKWKQRPRAVRATPPAPPPDQVWPHAPVPPELEGQVDWSRRGSA